jgi:hypothetical protein
VPHTLLHSGPGFFRALLKEAVEIVQHLTDFDEKCSTAMAFCVGMSG